MNDWFPTLMKGGHDMKLAKYISTASIVCSMTLGAGSAFAASPDDITISGTGADSNQQVRINNDSDVVLHNTSTVEVKNASFQNAETGDVDADKNTSVGGLSSGDATNTNGTSTDVAIDNAAEEATVPDNNQPVGGSGGVTPTGSVQGASVTPGMGAGAAVLPEVGASVPMDVSALRDGWHPQSATAALAKKSEMFTGLMLLTATLLSLLGAVGSFWYAKRQERV
jgi:hypothetical protein